MQYLFSHKYRRWTLPFDFSNSKPPFVSTNGRNVLVDPVVLGAVQRAHRKGVAVYNLPKWIKDKRTYLRNMYSFDEDMMSTLGEDYIWTMTLAFMLTLEASEKDSVDFHSPYLPYALVGESRNMEPEDLFFLHQVCFAHAILDPVSPATNSWADVVAAVNIIMEAAVDRFASRYTVAEHHTPSLLTDRIFPGEAQNATTNYRRWTLNLMSVSTGYVCVGQQIRPQHRNKKRRKR